MLQTFLFARYQIVVQKFLYYLIIPLFEHLY
jgi:hypothetical protein